MDKNKETKRSLLSKAGMAFLCLGGAVFAIWEVMAIPVGLACAATGAACIIVDKIIKKREEEGGEKPYPPSETTNHHENFTKGLQPTNTVKPLATGVKTQATQATGAKTQQTGFTK